MTNKINGQKLTFLISNDSVLSLVVTDKMVTDIQVESDFIADIILPKEKRNYNRLERHLQYLLDTKKSLPEILEQIKKLGFSTPIHYNLHIDITEVQNSEQTQIQYKRKQKNLFVAKAIEAKAWLLLQVKIETKA